MVWVCPPHTSMNLYCRPGSHSSAIRADSTRAFSASRNSSTNLIDRSSLAQVGLGERDELVGVGLAHALEHPDRMGRLRLVDLGQGEPDVDQDPVAGLQLLVLQQADVDHAFDAGNADHREVLAVGQQLDDLTRYAEAHGVFPSLPADSHLADRAVPAYRG